MIFGALHKIAAKENIHFILAGNNWQTEWLLPKRWYYAKFDYENIKSIHSAYGEVPIRKLPALGIWQWAYYHHIHNIRSVRLLELIDYHKLKAKAYLMDEARWRDYGGKHYESIFTRFYQGYILPNKFNIDKRKAHLSNLILNEEISREDALAELENPTYDEDLQQQDKEYVAKKLGFSTAEFEQVLTMPNRGHEEFGTDAGQRALYYKLARYWGALRSRAWWKSARLVTP
jgi:hypothetical protein